MKRITIVCDDCGKEGGSQEGPSARASSLRASLWPKGWRGESFGRDLCPDCREARKGQKEEKP